MPRPDRVVFRLPPVSLFIPLLVFVLVTPLVTAGSSWLRAFFLVPVIALAYILLTATIADARQIRTTGLRGGRKFTWAELNGFEFHGQRWATAVGLDGSRVRLPMVRPRDLPRLVEVSGGRMTLEPVAEQPEESVRTAHHDSAGDPATTSGPLIEVEPLITPEPVTHAGTVAASGPNERAVDSIAGSDDSR